MHEGAAVERQLYHFLRIDHRADGGVLGLHENGVGLHLDALGGLADGEADIEAGHLIDGELELADFGFLEARGFDGERIETGGDEVELVAALLIRGGSAGLIGLRVANFHLGAGDEGAGRVGNSTGDLGGGGLRQGAGSEGEGGESELKQSHGQHSSTPRRGAAAGPRVKKLELWRATRYSR